jgi:L-ascorbate metabolism protein UlaG (beta-lactamase superfamily)
LQRKRRSWLWRWLRRGLIVFAACVLVLFLGLVVSSAGLKSFGGKLSGARLQRAQRSPNFKDGKFVNPVPTDKLEPGTLMAMLREELFGGEERVPKTRIAVVRRAKADFATAPALRATWIGHASTLIEIDGRRVLTDPIWSERASPSTWVGPLRFHPPPLPLAELPAIDVVLISHDHFDHLDMATVKELAARGTRFAVPLGIGAHFDVWGIDPTRVIELDWHERTEIAGLRIIAAPARHYSGRNPLRGDETLWASWVIVGPTRRAFFSGDSGYFDGFAATGAKHGPFDIAIVKIGASHWTWADIHMQPEDAVRTALDVRARLLMPVHWGTFNLAVHAWNEPASRVVAAAKKANLPLVIPRPGELVNAAEPPSLVEWWR